MNSLQLAKMFLGNNEKIRLSAKQAKWLSDLRIKEGNIPVTGIIGRTDNNEPILFNEAKTMFSAYGGSVGKKGTGTYYLQIN
jgi:hypothetical protein